VAANPTMHGFTNVTSTACKIDPNNSTLSILTCNPTSYASPDAYQTYLFVASVHPTVAGHQLLGQYVVSVLEAPRLQLVLSHSGQTIGHVRADQVSNHLGARLLCWVRAYICSVCRATSACTPRPRRSAPAMRRSSPRSAAASEVATVPEIEMMLGTPGTPGD